MSHPPSIALPEYTFHGIRRAKIVCTLGPATRSDQVLRELMRSGMDVARLNFSHGTHADHARMIERVRRLAHEEKRTIALLQDLQGPKIRTGRLKGHSPVLLRAGARVIITPRDVPGTSTLISTTFTGLAREVTPQERILLADGLIELRVRAIHGDDVECDVVNGGLLGEHKGINLPGAVFSLPSLTEKDKQDLAFGLQQGVDMVALSFVRTADDVRAAKRLMGTGRHAPPLVAKLEKPQAIEHLDDILDAADAVMVARGDLGVEMPPEVVPVMQKEIIRRAGEQRKPVITATQMLESMIENPRPTRAEASDVANAIFDGTDAVMLSAETAAGKYPVEAVSFMSRVILEAEGHMPPPSPRHRVTNRLSIPETICESVAHAACELDMRAIAVFTETGTTARLISKYRPPAPIYAFTHDSMVANWLNVCWGVHPRKAERPATSEDMLNIAVRDLLKKGAVAPGDVIGVVAGTTIASPGSTNLMRLHVVESYSRSTAKQPLRKEEPV